MTFTITNVQFSFPGQTIVHGRHSKKLFKQSQKLVDFKYSYTLCKSIFMIK